MTTKSLQSCVAIISLMAVSSAQPVHAQQQTGRCPKNLRVNDKLPGRPNWNLHPSGNPEEKFATLRTHRHRGIIVSGRMRAPLAGFNTNGISPHIEDVALKPDSGDDSTKDSTEGTNADALR
jgi:hypothetical protein